MLLKQSAESLLEDWIRIRVFVPCRDEQQDHPAEMQKAFAKLSNYFQAEGRPVGTLGDYDCVCYTTKAREHYVARDPDKAYLEVPPDYSVCFETWCSPGVEETVVSVLRAVHSYHHPVIEVEAVRLAKPKQTSGGIQLNRGEPLDVLPPNQQLVAPGKWPIVGEHVPRQSNDPWMVTVKGLVEYKQTSTLDELLGLLDKDHEQTVNIHCVTRWSKLHVKFGGVPLHVLLDQCGVLPQVKFINFIARSDRNHSTSLPLRDALNLDALIAFTCEGQPLEEIHGGPVRMVVPGRYFYKSVKWLETIELLEEDKLGYWEAETGYHNAADPWQEQRYAAPNLNRREVLELFKTKDFSGRDLRSIEADHQNLPGLNARGAALRDAHFRKANLEGACFDGANLSNAHLEGANLRNASFRRFDEQIADLEGADFRGADLRGAVFEDASLFGATFCSEPGDENPWGPALIDSTTKFDESTIASLSATPFQESLIRALLIK